MAAVKSSELMKFARSNKGLGGGLDGKDFVLC